MSTTTSKFLVTLALPKRFQAEIDALHYELDPIGLARIPSHITLVPPFASAHSAATLTSYLMSACEAFKPFFVVPLGTDASFPKSEITAVKLAPAPYIGRLAKHVALQLRPLMQPDGKIQVARLLRREFRPHITLARNHTPEEKAAAAELIDGRLANRLAHAQGIELWTLRDDAWVRCGHAPFRNPE